MKRRILRIGIPAAVAAAVVLAVGLWPTHGRKGGGSGRVYAMTDVPSLVQKATSMHMMLTLYQRDPSQPNAEPMTSEGEVWLDFENGRSYKRQSADPDCSNGASLGDRITVCDGQYVMEEFISKKISGECTQGVRFRKLTPFQSLLQTRLADFFFRSFGRADQVASFEIVGEEQRDGTLFNIWETTIDSGGRVSTPRVWLAPATGEIGRVQMSQRLPGQSDWSSMMDFHLVELDVPVPDSLFSTEPRPGFEPANSKETAPLSVLGGGQLENVERYGLNRHISFVLPGGSVLLGWSVWDRKNPDQQAAFEDLVPGGELPELPARVMSLTPLPPEGDQEYVGRHLAYTRTGRHCIEWSLYVPKQMPSAGEGLLGFHCDVEYRAKKNQFGCWIEGLNPDLEINSPEEFDTWVRGAMADMSDGDVAPEGISYAYVLQLIQEIRESLGTP